MTGRDGAIDFAIKTEHAKQRATDSTEGHI
jgi:hypothetical protein